MAHLEALSRKISLAVMRESDCGAKVEAGALSGRLHRWDWMGWQLAGERTERIWAVDLTGYVGGERKRVVRMGLTPDWTWEERRLWSLVF